MDHEPLAEVLHALAAPRLQIAEATTAVADAPGLYAIYADDAAWDELGLRAAFDGQPLYVGKAEQSLRNRDVRTHFASGRTGSSTVRRSLAALLVGRLRLAAVPRNVARPDGSANFALAPDSDARLTTWMTRHLSLATWEDTRLEPLGDVETAVLARLRPPLNLAKVGEPRERLRAARRRLADQSRMWRGDETS